jgi:toxin ParE1/3/4
MSRLVFYRVNDESKSVEIHRVLRGTWNLPQYLE